MSTASPVRRSKAPRVKTVSRGRLNGHGESVADAKADLNSRIDSALASHYTPSTVRYGEWIALVWRELDGWYYRIIAGPDRTIPDGIEPHSWCSSPGQETRRAAEQQAGAHILGLALDVETTRTDGDIPGWLTDPSGRENILRCARFNRAYRHAKREGIETDSDRLHRWACHHAGDPQFD